MPLERPSHDSSPSRSSMVGSNTSRPRNTSRVHFLDIPTEPVAPSPYPNDPLFLPSSLSRDVSAASNYSVNPDDFEPDRLRFASDSTLFERSPSRASFQVQDVADASTPIHRSNFPTSPLRQSESVIVSEAMGLDDEGSGAENADLVIDPVSGTTTDLLKIAEIDSESLNLSAGKQDPAADEQVLANEKSMLSEDPFEVERERLRKMDYKQRRKERQKVKIEYNITSVVNRQKFLLRLARALMAFGSPSHRIETQLTACSKILEVGAEFVHIPGVIICSFGDPETKTSETHFVKCNGGLALGRLHRVHQIYRSVVHDEICARTATVQLNELLAAPPIYSTVVRIIVAFLLSALICPLAFGGSLLDMSVAGVGAIIVSGMQFGVASKSALYANVFEITMAIFMSLIARGLSSIKGDYFCYTAISSAGIVSILPGYLILTSSLELASKNVVCGSVKMVYALIYTLFLGFGLQIGSDFYLLFDRRARRHLDDVSNRLTQKVSLAATYIADNASTKNARLNGTFLFTHQTPYNVVHIYGGCLRSPGNPWYMQPYPWWTQFILVPIFSTLSSLANMQPIMAIQLPVMVIISCAAYAANKAANHYIFNRSDVVSAIGAFVVGVLGNTYSRKMGGTAFTSMVTGVLFLVPSGLSQAGGLTAGSGIDIGGAMIAVTIGITVGLFMSQALVYTFGSRKNAAMFSF